jgi:alpha-L-rhamnosidase
MNSFNHYSFGAIGAWMINVSLGIQRDEKSPGFRHFFLQPTSDPTRQMTWAKGHYNSMYGRIESEWKVDESKVSYQFTVPANTSATLSLQAKGINAIVENGNKLSEVDGIELIGQEGDKVMMELSPGKYHFQVDL